MPKNNTDSLFNILMRQALNQTMGIIIRVVAIVHEPKTIQVLAKAIFFVPAGLDEFEFADLRNMAQSAVAPNVSANCQVMAKDPWVSIDAPVGAKIMALNSGRQYHLSLFVLLNIMSKKSASLIEISPIPIAAPRF